MVGEMVDEKVAKSVDGMGGMTVASQVVLWVAMTVGQRADWSVDLSAENLVCLLVDLMEQKLVD